MEQVYSYNNGARMEPWVSRYQNVSILDNIGAKDDGSGGDSWSYKTVESSSQHVTTSKPTPSFSADQMPFLSPIQQCQSIEGKT